jgi:hypothetical protein
VVENAASLEAGEKLDHVLKIGQVVVNRRSGQQEDDFVLR